MILSHITPANLWRRHKIVLLLVLAIAMLTGYKPLAAAPVAPTGAITPAPTCMIPVAGKATAVTPAVKDAAYATLSSAQKLDLYLPTGAGPFPVIVIVHGGGFMMGDKADSSALTGVEQLLAAGYAVASLNYRLSGEAIAPAQIQDIKTAVRWLRAHAATYQLDAAHIGAWGASAGGNLVALLGASCDVAALEGADLGNSDQSSCIQAVVDWFGPTDFLQMDQQFEGTGCPQTHDAADSPESRLLGAPIQTVPELARAANPITYVSDQAPPFLIQHGTADCNVPPQQSQLLYAALVPAIGTDKVTLTVLQGAGHGGAQFTTAANLQIVLDFFAAHLQAAPTDAYHIADVTITGAATSARAQTTSFTATLTLSPATTIILPVPVTYTWQATDYSTPVVEASLALTSTVPYSWSAPGIKHITVTVTSAASALTGLPRSRTFTTLITSHSLYLPLILRNTMP